MNQNLIKFLSLVGISEGTSTSPITKNNGYDVIVTSVNGPSIFTDYSTHPFENRPPLVVRLVPRVLSDAAGRYQIMLHNFDVYKVQLKLPDFSPASQDKIALQMIGERHATTLIEAGNIEAAIEACSNIWASFPGNTYGQNPHQMSDLISKWNALE